MADTTEEEKRGLELMIKGCYDEIDEIDAKINALQKDRQEVMKGVRANTSKLVTLQIRGK